MKEVEYWANVLNVSSVLDDKPKDCSRNQQKVRCLWYLLEYHLLVVNDLTERQSGEK